MGFLSDDIPLDETTAAAMENASNKSLCNVSAMAHGHSSNPYIPAWYLQVFCADTHVVVCAANRHIKRILLCVYF